MEYIIIPLIPIIILLSFVFFIKYISAQKDNIEEIRYIKPKYNYYTKVFSYILFVFSIFFLMLSAIIVFGNNENKPKNSNTNIVFVLDVSKSMNSIDIKENSHFITRLDFSKQAIKNYISKHPNYKYGLVIFAGQAQAVVPLTTDINVFSTLLDGVDYRNLTKQGTNFSQALKFAINRFKNYKGEKILIFISDGGDPGDYKGVDISIPKDLKTFVFGVGTEKGGPILLGQNVFGENKFQTYKGEYVITKLNEENLKKLAKDINGKYFRLKKINDLTKIDKYIKNNSNKANNKINKKTFKNISILFLIISFLFFLLSYYPYFFKNINILHINKLINLNFNQKTEKLDIKTNIVDICNIELKGGLHHFILSLVSLGIYNIIYNYKRFKLRNCLVYGNKNCCDETNYLNIIYLAFMTLIFLYLVGNMLLDNNKIELIIYNFFIVIAIIILIGNIITGILYFSLKIKKPAKLLFSIIIGWLLLLNLLSGLNSWIYLALPLILIMSIFLIYAYFVDNFIQKNFI